MTARILTAEELIEASDYVLDLYTSDAGERMQAIRESHEALRAERDKHVAWSEQNKRDADAAYEERDRVTKAGFEVVEMIERILAAIHPPTPGLTEHVPLNARVAIGRGFVSAMRADLAAANARVAKLEAVADEAIGVLETHGYGVPAERLRAALADAEPEVQK